MANKLELKKTCNIEIKNTVQNRCLVVTSFISIKTCKSTNVKHYFNQKTFNEQLYTFNALAKIAHRRRATFFFSLPNCKTSWKSILHFEFNAKISLDWSIELAKYI